MKKMYSLIKILSIIVLALFVTSCVHDDKYDNPDLNNYQCGDLTATKTLAELKAMPQNTTITSDDVIEGYVSSSDETGNIYKYIYIQDKPENPTQGLVISVDAVSTYTNYPQGSKIYIKLNGLAVGKYGNFVQLGAMSGTTFGRIPEKTVATNLIRSCTTSATIVPKVMTLAEMGTANDQYVGVLIKVENAEFASRSLCMQYAPEGTSVDRQLNDPTNSTTTRVVRNSGFASFANKTIPSGNGSFIGILSKYNSTYQFYINRESDLKMTSFPRLDGIASAPCTPDPAAAKKTVAEVKAMINGTLSQITENATVTAKVVANDKTGNLYKYFYIEDETGGIRVNVNMTDMYLDKRFMVGRMLTINLKDLYLGNVEGEIYLGALFQGNIGQIETVNTYKHLFSTELPLTNVVPTERTITTLQPSDVGRWIKIKDLQFIDGDVGKNYADGTNNTNRTLEDCSGNKLILRTSGYADFGTRDNPKPASSTEVDSGKGDVYGILSIYRGTYQLWITKLTDVDLDNPRCDGTIPAKYETIFKEEFANLSNWTAVNVTGTQAWTTTTFGNPAPSAIMDGNRLANEDWLLSKSITIASDYTDAYFSFDTDGRYTGNALEVYITENYSTPTTTTWTKLDVVLDANLGAFNTWTSSGKINLKNYLGKNIVVAFKYTSVAGASTTWELDNFVVKGTK